MQSRTLNHKNGPFGKWGIGVACFVRKRIATAANLASAAPREMAMSMLAK